MAAERDRARELYDDARQPDDARGWGATVTLAPESQGSQAATSVADAPGTGGSRLSALVDWLRGRVDTSLGRLALVWFRRYFEASRNSGAAAAGYITLSVLPTALVVI